MATKIAHAYPGQGAQFPEMESTFQGRHCKLLLKASKS